MRNADIRKMFVRHCAIRQISLSVDEYGVFHDESLALFEMFESGYAHGRGDGFIAAPSLSPAQLYFDFVTEDMT
jgi:hypothetical protein